MSTLKLDTLSNKAGTASVPSDTIVSGTAKAWVNFNGTGTVAIRRAFNVSSITDITTGDYQINFSNAMSDANYAIVTNGNRTNDERIGARQSESTTAKCLIRSSDYTGGSNRDTDSVFVAIFS